MHHYLIVLSVTLANFLKLGFFTRRPSRTFIFLLDARFSILFELVEKWNVNTLITFTLIMFYDHQHNATIAGRIGRL